MENNDNKLVVDKKLIINILYAVILFFAFTSIISVLAYLIQQLSLESMYRDDSMIIALCVIHLLVSTAGLTIFMVSLFTDRLSARALIFAEVIIVAVMLIGFIVGVVTSSTLPLTTILQQTIYISALLGINLFQAYKNRNRDNENDDEIDSADDET